MVRRGSVSARTQLTVVRRLLAAALRFSTDERPPSLYWSEIDGALTVVSEPLDAQADHWNEVPTSHLLTIENGHVALQRFAL